jgi:hypothetical protein
MSCDQGRRTVIVGAAAIAAMAAREANSWYRDKAIKWSFTRITRQNFVWRGFELDADGTTWRMVTEFNLQRRG